MKHQEVIFRNPVKIFQIFRNINAKHNDPWKTDIKWIAITNRDAIHDGDEIQEQLWAIERGLA